MSDRPFIVLQGDPESLPIDHPHYFRGRFGTHAEAVARCEELLAVGFPMWEAVVRHADLCHYELDSLLIIHFPSPSIWNEHTGYDYTSYSSVDSYRRYQAEVERNLRIPRFHRGERVRYTRSRESPFFCQAGNVYGSEFLDSGVYPADPPREFIAVRFDFDGLVHQFPANELYQQCDDTNKTYHAERWQLLHRLVTEFESHANAA